MSYAMLVRRYAPFAQFGGGFEGDNRTTASADPGASARTIGTVVFGRAGIASVGARSSGTAWVGLGPEVAKMLGSYKSKVLASVSVKSSSVDGLSFIVSTGGANPFPLVNFASPKIETFVDVSISFSRTNLEIAGTVRGDDFPNAEILIVDEGLNAVILFDFATSGGQTTGPFTRLPLSHVDQVIGYFTARLPLGRGDRFVMPSAVSGARWSSGSSVTGTVWNGGGGGFSGGGASGKF